MKKIISFIIAALMMLTLAAPIFAESNEVIGYDSSRIASDSNTDVAIDIETLADTSAEGYDAQLGFSPLLLEENTYFYIDSVAGMKLFSKIVSCGDALKVSDNPYCFLGKTVYLHNDIDFEGGSMTPIGENGRREKVSVNSGIPSYTANDVEGTQVNFAEYSKSYFAGTFDGRGYSIRNLDMVSEYATEELGKFGNAIALFKVIRGDATIKNLVIDSDSSFINNCSEVAKIAESGAGRGNIAASLVAYAITNTGANFGDSKGYTIDNVSSGATVKAITGTKNLDYRYNLAGGIVAVTNVVDGATSIKNCTFSGSIPAAGWSAAGIVAHVNQATAAASFNITNCLNTAAIVANGYAGGILGCDVQNAPNRTSNKYVSCTIENCLNSGKISVNNAGAFSGEARYAGAILGCNTDSLFNESLLSYKSYTFKNCINSNEQTAAFIGKSSTTAIAITSCTNNGNRVADRTFGENVESNGFIDGEGEYDFTVGYNASAVVKKDLTNIPPICAYLDLIMNEITATEFKISTPEDLKYISELSLTHKATFAGMTIYLENDLNMQGVAITPIGAPKSGYVDVTDSNKIAASGGFSGTFDGQGHVIENLVISSTVGTEKNTDAVVVGLFGLTQSATIRNVVLGSGCSFTYTKQDTTNHKNKAYVGAIVALSSRNNADTGTVIENCYSAATVQNNSTVGAGILAVYESNNNTSGIASVRNCTNAGKITAINVASGIVGTTYTKRRVQIDKCRNTGDVEAKHAAVADSNAAAGILALPAQQSDARYVTYVSDCINNGTVKAPTHAAGMVGFITHTTLHIKNSTNYGEIILSNSSGISGPIYGECEITVFDNITNNFNATGRYDASNVSLSITPSYPDYVALEATHKAFIDGLEPPAEDDEANDETENSPSGESQNEAPSADTDITETDSETEEEKKKGCGSTVSAIYAVLATAIVTGVAFKKKED